MNIRRTLARAAALVVLAAPALSACSESGPTLTVYNAQHEELISQIAPLFEEETGIKVELRHGKDLELANQLVTEGDKTPADVFLTENSPAMNLVNRAGLFNPIDSTTQSLIPDQYRPSDNNWTGFLARSTVLVYNTDQIDEGEMPDSILDLAKPEWKDKIAFSPSGADFQAIVSAVLQLEGETATAAWLQGIADNGRQLQGNSVVMEAVNAGEVPVGVIYHYYWFRDQAESGANSSNTDLHFFDNQDPGAFVSISGAGVLKSSDEQANAQKFVAFLADKAGQQAMADSYALEYPLNPEVTLPEVKPFTELDPPTVDLSALNSPEVVRLMQDAGLL